MFGTSKKRKIMRYKVTLKGTQISKHSTKVLANKAAKKIRGARVVKLQTRRKTFRKKRY